MKINRGCLALVICIFLLFSITFIGCRKNIVQIQPEETTTVEVPKDLYPKEQRQVAPEFNLPILDGSGDLSLASLKGKYILIDFTTTWCGYCTLQEPQVIDLHKKYETKGFTVIAIDCEESKQIVLGKYPSGKNLYPVILDEDGYVSKKLYGIQGYPLYLLIDKNGKVAYVQSRYKENMFQTVSEILDYLMKNES